MLENRKLLYINNILMALCEKYNYEFLIDSAQLGKIKESRKVYYTDFQNFNIAVLNCNNSFIVAEVISLVYNTLQLLGFKKIKLNINKSLMGQYSLEKLSEYLELLDITYNLDSKESDQEILWDIQISNYKNKLSIGKYTDTKISGELDLNQVLDILTKEEIKLPLDNSIDVFICYHNEEEKETALYLSQDLRINGFSCDTDYLDSDLEKQLKKSLEFNSKYVIILDDQDINNFVVNIKDNKTNEEQKIPINDLVDYLDMNM